MKGRKTNINAKVAVATAFFSYHLIKLIINVKKGLENLTVVVEIRDQNMAKFK